MEGTILGIPAIAVSYSSRAADRIPGYADVLTDLIGALVRRSDFPEETFFNINLPDTGETIAGVCHAKGSNANLPSQWLIYVRVESVADSAQRCTKMGGKVLEGPRRMGGSNFCVIQDPAGAVMALLSD